MTSRVAALLLSLLVGYGAKGANPSDGSAEEWIVRSADGEIGSARSVPVSEPYVVASFNVSPNVVGIAKRPSAIPIPLRSGAELEFPSLRFEARSGFSFDEKGEIVVSEDPAELSYYWYGQAGENYLFVTVELGHMHALLFGPKIRIAIDAAGGELPVLRELDPHLVDQGGCAVDYETRTEKVAKDALNGPQSAIPFASQALERNLMPKYFAQLTVMFYYTDAAIAQYNGDVAALSSAATALVDQLNQSLTNTEETYYISFSRVGALTYVGSYAEQPLPPVTDPNTRYRNHILQVMGRDDPLVGITPRRDTEGADLAFLLVNDVGEPNAVPPDPIFGTAVLQRANCFNTTDCQIGTTGFREFAYGVVSINPQVANLTFSHEIGHTLGGQHDPNVSFQNPSPGAYAYSFGYRESGIAWDIMADPQCVENLFTPMVCTPRVPQFSNPLVVFQGTTLDSGVSGTRDVALTIRRLAETTGNIYPLTDAQSAPDIFWGGLEH